RRMRAFHVKVCSLLTKQTRKSVLCRGENNHSLSFRRRIRKLLRHIADKLLKMSLDLLVMRLGNDAQSKRLGRLRAKLSISKDSQNDNHRKNHEPTYALDHRHTPRTVLWA